MSEYQRYEFMTSDRPLTQTQQREVKRLSSHIEASSTHALIEYHWGNFKHDPIAVLYSYFDGFLYWANWGAPQLAFRLPRGVLPTNLLNGYDLDEFVTFSPRPEYDILDIHFAEMEGPDEWIDYDLGSLMSIRDELMDGDLRALYIVWLAAQRQLGSYDEEENYDVYAPPVPPAFGALTSAQQALADLLQTPRELLNAVARHSVGKAPSPEEDVADLVELLPPERRLEYLKRLAHNEPGLGRLLAHELRTLRPGVASVASPLGKQVTYATALAESQVIKRQMEQDQREREERARLRALQQIHDHQDEHWQRVTLAAERGSGTGYDEATRLLVELRGVADHFGESRAFQEHFQAWVQPHLRRPAFARRLRENEFPLPEA